VRRLFFVLLPAVLFLGSHGIHAQSPASAATDLDRFMASALQRRDIDRKTLSDYVLDEVETVDVLGPGQTPVFRSRRDYTWYVRDGIHVRSPLKVDGVPVPEADRRAYEERWFKSEESRRKFRTKREEKRAEEGKGPALSAPSINEPRFVAESYFMDFKFEPGNYYLAGREKLEGQDVLKIEYYPTKLFNDDDDEKTPHEMKKKKPDPNDKEKKEEQEIERKMNKTALVTLWVDPKEHQIVKYTFDNVWMDFLPGAWLIRVDDIRASMTMGQPFPGVWLPRGMNIHAGITLANGSYEAGYARAFSDYREADVKSTVRIPKKDGGR